MTNTKVGTRIADFSTQGWIDITIPLHHGMVHWPGEPVQTKFLHHMDHGDPVNLSEISMNTHSGTHFDAPRHFYKDGITSDLMPLDMGIGLARVIEIQDRVSIKIKELEAHNIQPGERLLFKTCNALKVVQTDNFFVDYVYFEIDAAHYLAGKGIRMVGMDYMSVGNKKDEINMFETHRAFLSKGVWILESLDLSTVKPGIYEFICLPIKIAQGEGGPCRAIIKPL